MKYVPVVPTEAEKLTKVVMETFTHVDHAMCVESVRWYHVAAVVCGVLALLLGRRRYYHNQLTNGCIVRSAAKKES